MWVTSCWPRSYAQRTAWSTAPVFLSSLSTTGGKTPYRGGQKEQNGSCWKMKARVLCPFERETIPWHLWQVALLPLGSGRGGDMSCRLIHVLGKDHHIHCMFFYS